MINIPLVLCGVLLCSACSTTFVHKGSDNNEFYQKFGVEDPEEQAVVRLKGSPYGIYGAQFNISADSIRFLHPDSGRILTYGLDQLHTITYNSKSLGAADGFFLGGLAGIATYCFGEFVVLVNSFVNPGDSRNSVAPEIAGTLVGGFFIGLGIHKGHCTVYEFVTEEHGAVDNDALLTPMDQIQYGLLRREMLGNSPSLGPPGDMRR